MAPPTSTPDDPAASGVGPVPAGWDVADGRLRREFRFPDFVSAFGFMSSVALLAERQDHHPDWSNSYGEVVIELTSHDVGHVTERDLRLANAINAIAP